MLSFIRQIAPGDVKGEIREVYKYSLQHCHIDYIFDTDLGYLAIAANTSYYLMQEHYNCSNIYLRHLNWYLWSRLSIIQILLATYCNVF